MTGTFGCFARNNRWSCDFGEAFPTQKQQESFNCLHKTCAAFTNAYIKLHLVTLSHGLGLGRRPTPSGARGRSTTRRTKPLTLLRCPESFRLEVSSEPPPCLIYLRTRCRFDRRSEYASAVDALLISKRFSNARYTGTLPLARFNKGEQTSAL